MNNIKQELSNCIILENEPLSNYTNTKTGGPADWLGFPRSIGELKSMLKYANDHQIPVTVIGNASNLIVKDGGVRGLVLILTKMIDINVDQNNETVTAEAGAAIIKVSETAYTASLSGLEFAAGIPGSVGGAVFMNAGAYGGETKNVVSEVVTVDLLGDEHHYSNSEMNFGYRHSLVQDNGEIVVYATFQLSKGNQEEIREEMDDLNARRAAKQPLEYPSCGSVFKRPEGYYAGKLISDSGLQGYTSGGAQVSLKHAGFIVNIGHATATDYLNVIKHVQDTVFEKFKVHLETEVRIIGED